MRLVGKTGGRWKRRPIVGLRPLVEFCLLLAFSLETFFLHVAFSEQFDRSHSLLVLLQLIAAAGQMKPNLLQLVGDLGRLPVDLHLESLQAEDGGDHDLALQTHGTLLVKLSAVSEQASVSLSQNPLGLQRLLDASCGLVPLPLPQTEDSVKAKLHAMAWL